ncbi:Uncharacterised protein [Burkholderia pseudomallei]|nr:Uncharacterised protein [Burkholderia pseudomallei]
MTKIAANASNSVPPLALTHCIRRTISSCSAAPPKSHTLAQSDAPATSQNRNTHTATAVVPSSGADTSPRPGRNFASTSSGAPCFSSTLRAMRSVVSSDSEKRTSALRSRRPRARPAKNHIESASTVAATAATSMLA